MKKQWFSVLSILLALTLVIAGCGSGSSQQTQSRSEEGSTGSEQPAQQNNNGKKASEEDVAEVRKIVMWGGIPEENGPQDVVDAWNAANPDIQVEYVRYVNDDAGNTKLDTALISRNDAPDIFISYGEAHLNRRLNAGMSIPLDDLIEEHGFDVDAVIGLDNIQQYNDHIHYLPANKIFDTVILNKAALDEIGERVPTSWTWDEYNELAIKLTRDGMYGSFITPGSDLFVAKFALGTAQPVDAFYNADGLSNFDHPAVKKGLELQKVLYDQGAMVPYAEAVANKLDAANELLTGKAAMVYGGTWMLRTIKDTEKYPRDFAVAFAPVPQYEKGTNVNNGGLNDFMSINKQSKHPDAAFQFMAWYLQEGNIHMVSGGRIPTSKQADFAKVTELLIGQDGDIIDQDSLNALLQGNPSFTTRFKSTAYPQLNTILREEAEKYFMDVEPIEKIVDNLKSRSDAAILEEQ